MEHEWDSSSSFYSSLASLLSSTNDPLGMKHDILSLHCGSNSEVFASKSKERQNSRVLCPRMKNKNVIEYFQVLLGLFLF